MDRLRVGVIGCGAIAQIMHLPYLRQLSDRYEIAALCDLSPRLVEEVGDYYNVSRRYTDYRDLLAAGSGQTLDAVIVLTAGSHAPPALEALRAGKHVLVEKPMCFTLREADEMIAAAEASECTLMVAYMKRYDPGYRYAQAALPSLGALRIIQVNTLHPSEEDYLNVHRIVRTGDIPREVVEQLAADRDRLATEAIGSVAEPLRFIYTDIVLGSLVHDVNALRGLVGGPVAVTFTDIWPGGEKLPCITTVLRHSGGLRAVVTWAWLPDLRHYFEEIALMSASGRVRIQFPSPYLRHFPSPVIVELMEDGAAVEKRVTASYAEAFKEELIHFHECVTQGKKPLTDVHDARRDIEILQQVVAAFDPPGLGGEAKRVRVGS
jgi:predicted dehydrogenase